MGFFDAPVELQANTVKAANILDELVSHSGEPFLLFTTGNVFARHLVCVCVDDRYVQRYADAWNAVAKEIDQERAKMGEF